MKNYTWFKQAYTRTKSDEQRNFFWKYYWQLPLRKRVFVDYIINKNRKQKHRLHVVAPSPWPIYSAASAFLFVLGMILWLNYYTMFPLICGFFSIITSFIFWFRDIIREGVYMGYHTEIVQSCLRLGFVLFLVSEVMFFFGFFWALFHYSLTPSIFIGGVWPPQGIVLFLMSENFNDQSMRAAHIWKSQIPVLRQETHAKGYSTLVNTRLDFEFLCRHCDRWPLVFKVPQTKYWLLDWTVYQGCFKGKIFMKDILYGTWTNLHVNFYSRGVLVNPYKIPLANTALLLTSGGMLTLSHSYLRTESYLPAFRLLNATIIFGLIFIYFQGYEYFWSTFAMNDGVYGSIFYMLTGFHGFHVIVGTAFLIVCSFRLRASHFTHNNHFAFEAAAWYWHFVDVVWILLYLLVYLWPNAKFFGCSGNITINPFLDSTVINLNQKYFFRYCTLDWYLRWHAGTNFEYNYPLKLIVMKSILQHFEHDIRAFEQKNSELTCYIWNHKFSALQKYTHWTTRPRLKF